MSLSFFLISIADATGRIKENRPFGSTCDSFLALQNANDT